VRQERVTFPIRKYATDLYICPYNGFGKLSMSPAPASNAPFRL